MSDAQNVGIGSFISSFLLARQNKERKEERDREAKAAATLAEIQIRKLQREDEQAREEAQKARTTQQLRNVNRSLITSDAELAVGTGQKPDLASALADTRAQLDMRKYGFDPEKDFGVQRPPADIQELQYLQQHPDLAALDRQRRQAGATTINTGEGFGKIEGGEQYVRDPATGQIVARTVPGSKSDRERVADVAQRDAAYKNAAGGLALLRKKAEQLKNNPNLWLGVGLGGVTAKVPGSPGADVQADIESLVAQVAFGALQAMRDASKTGGALGAVSERELALLQSSLTALSEAQSPEQYRARLQDLLNWADSAERNLREAYEAQQAPAGLGATPPALGAPSGMGTTPPRFNNAPVAIQSDAEYEKLPSGTVFVGPDGVPRRKP